MAKSGRVAIAELVSRGKEQLVLIRPYRKGLVRLASGFRANFFTNYP
jgi:non-homologous end joining protein Ku